MTNFPLKAYSSPFSAGYWREAAGELKRPRTLAFAALMIAACGALAQIPAIPIGDQGLEVTWGFLARSVCGMVCGPVTALVFGFAEDTISFLIHPTGAYFPGYALTTMLGTMLYALWLYRVKFTPVSLPLRVLGAKLCTNALNVVLGSLWSTILYGKGYLVRLTASLVKNTLMLPVQTVMLFFLILALLPILSRMDLVPRQELKKPKTKKEDPWES